MTQAAFVFCLVLDSTGSMGNHLDAVKAMIAGLSSRDLNEDTRFVLVLHTEDSRLSAVEVLDCGTHLDSLKARVARLKLGEVDNHSASGGDGPENHIHAHYAAQAYISKTYPNARTLTLAVTDAPVHLKLNGGGEYEAESKALLAMGVDARDAFERLQLLLTRLNGKSMVIYLAFSTFDPWHLHLAASTGGAACECTTRGSLAQDLGQLIRRVGRTLESAREGRSEPVETMQLGTMKPYTLVHLARPATEAGNLSIDAVRPSDWANVFKGIFSHCKGVKFEGRVGVRGGGEAFATAALLCEALKIDNTTKSEKEARATADAALAAAVAKVSEFEVAVSGATGAVKAALEAGLGAAKGELAAATTNVEAIKAKEAEKLAKDVAIAAAADKVAEIEAAAKGSTGVVREALIAAAKGAKGELAKMTPNQIKMHLEQFDKADQPCVEAAFKHLLEVVASGAKGSQVCCVSLDMLGDVLEAMAADTDPAGRLKLFADIVSGRLVQIGFMKGPDGPDFANAWAAQVTYVGASPVNLATFLALKVDEDGNRLDPITRKPCNGFLPWLSNATPLDEAVFRFLTAGRLLDTIATTAVMGLSEKGLQCFPSMQPGLVASVAWRVLGGEATEHKTTLLKDAVGMLRAHGRPVSPSTIALFQKNQMSPEPAPGQLLAAFLNWGEAPEVRMLVEELVTARLMEMKRYTPKMLEVVAWADLCPTSGFDPLLGTHALEKEFVVSVEAVEASVRASELYGCLELFAATLTSIGVPVDLETFLSLVTTSLLLGKRTARYKFDGVHKRVEVPSIQELAAAKCREESKPTLAGWAELREVEGTRQLLAGLASAVTVPEMSPEGTEAFKAILEGGVKWVSPWGKEYALGRGHVEAVLKAGETFGPALRLIVWGMAFLDGWTKDPAQVLTSVAEEVGKLLPEFAEEFRLRIKAHVLCGRKDAVDANRHGHWKGAQAASVLRGDTSTASVNARVPVKTLKVDLGKYEEAMMKAREAAREILTEPLSPPAKTKLRDIFEATDLDPSFYIGPGCLARRAFDAIKKLDTAAEWIPSSLEGPRASMMKSTHIKTLEAKAAYWTNEAVKCGMPAPAEPVKRAKPVKRR